MQKHTKILIFRSIEATSMHFVVKDVEEYFSNPIVSILTKKENYYAMQMMKNIYEVIIFPKDHFFLNELTKSEIIKLSEYKFDKIIIPINGQIESYENIKNLSITLFKKAEIYYYLYPKQFIKDKKTFFNNTFYLRPLKTFVFVASVLLTMIISIYIILFQILKFFKNFFIHNL